MMRRLPLCLALVALLLAPVGAAAKKGLYFGFNLGGGLVNGDSPVPFDQDVISKLDPDYNALCNGQPCTDIATLLSTDVGSGFAVNFRIGYNILGFVAIEAIMGGSGAGLGDSGTVEGQVGVYGLVRLFPAQLFAEVADRWWDPYIFVGAGVHFIGYNPDAHPQAGAMQNDGRAWWPGVAVKYGLGCDFYIVPFFSLGIDLAFINAFHDEFHIDDERGITATPTSTATAFIFQPTAKITFHFLTD